MADTMIAIFEALEQDDGPWTEREIGTIAGEPVYGHYYEKQLCYVRIGWAGLDVEIDVEQNEPRLAIPAFYGHPDNDVPLATWGRIKELAQTDVVEQLVRLTQQYA